MSDASSRGPFLIVGIVLVGLMVAIGALLLRPARTEAPVSVETIDEQPAPSGGALPAVPDPDRAERTAEGARQPATEVRKMPNAAAREALVRALTEARSRRERDEAAASTGGGRPAAAEPAHLPDEAPPGELSSEVIREAVREAIPLIRECYDMALEEDPALAGTLAVQFRIVGEPDVGALVEEATVAGDGTAPGNQTLTECVRETMYTLEFPPPENGGYVQVTYPFRFAPHEEDTEDR